MADVITRFKVESSEYEKKINKAKGSLSDFEKGANKLSSALGVNVSALAKVGTALGAVSGALKVAKDAFFNNEQNLDEWGRTVKASQSLYEGFLDSLNSGNISGFLSRIGQISQAARDAYDALDALGTYNAFNQVNIQKTRTGMNEAIADYREGTGSKEGVSSASSAYKKELKTRQKMEQDAYDKAIKNIAANRGVDAKMLDAVMKGTYGNYQQIKDTKMTGKRTYSYAGGWGQTYTREEAIPANKTEELGAMLRKLNDTELNNLQALGAQAQRTGEEIAQVDKQTARILGGKKDSSGTGKGKGGRGNNVVTEAAKGSIDWYNQEISKLNKTLSSTTDAEVRVNVQKLIDEYSKAMDLLKDRAKNYRWVETNEAFKNTDAYKNNNSYWSSYQANETVASSWSPDKDYSKLRIDPTKLKEATDEATRLFLLGKQVGGSWQEAAQAVGGLGSALAGLEDPAMKVVGIIAEAIANVALSMAQALTKKESQVGGVWGWIAAAAAGTATMIGTISAIKSATSYHAEGGIVGTSALARGTDTVPAMLTPGEIVLNRAQQGVLANRLQNSAFGQMQLSATIKGEDIRLALNNGSRRRGKGEYVTSK